MSEAPSQRAAVLTKSIETLELKVEAAISRLTVIEHRYYEISAMMTALKSVELVLGNVEFKD